MKVLLVAEEAAGVQALRAVAHSGHELVAVMTSADGRDEHASPVRDAATQMGYAAWPAAWVKDPSFAKRVREEEVDVLLNVHSLFLIRPEVLAAPRYGGYNMHPGPLPEYAGLDPVSWALYHGETTHGVTIHRLVPRVDSGPIAYQASFPIDEQDTALTLSVKCVKAGLVLMGQLLNALANDPMSVPEIPQDLSCRRYYQREVPHGGRLDWSGRGAEIVNFVRACDYVPFRSPWGHPTGTIGGDELAVVKATRTGKSCAAAPGTVGEAAGRAVAVAAGDEWVLVHRVLRAGESRDACDCLRSGERFATDGRSVGTSRGDSSPSTGLQRDVAAVFADVLSIKVPAHDTDLLATALLDSLGFVDLLLALERRFGVRVAMESLEPDNFRSIERIAAFIADQQRAGAVQPLTA